MILSTVKSVFNLAVLILILLLPLACQERVTKESPFCVDKDATLQYFKNLCDFIEQEKKQVPSIFITGYYMRTLVAGYEIFREQKYLDTAIAYADTLLKYQSDRGYWGTGYGNIYLADTGSAIALFTVLYKHVDEGRRAKYFSSISKYVTAIEKDSLINPSGAIGTGWYATKEGEITGTFRDEYTISSALTGAQIFTWMYHITKEDKYRQVSINALRWIMSTMREDGVIPYVLASHGSVLGKKGDPKNDYNLWEKWRYDTAAYVGEGIIAFDLYCDQPEWKAEIREKIRPHIELLIRSQNQDGTWAVPGSGDQKRSPGVVNFLIWYHQHVSQDTRIVDAVKKYNQFILAPESGKEYGLIEYGAEDKTINDVVTSINGRAVADILRPGVDARW